MCLGLDTGYKQTVMSLEAVQCDFSLHSGHVMLDAISVWLAQKHKYLSAMLQFTLLPIARASVSFGSLSYGLCLMFYCGKYFCKIFHSFPVTSLGHLSLNDYILVVVLLFLLLSTLSSSSTLIMILQVKCCFELTVPNKFSFENMYQFMQLRSKKLRFLFSCRPLVEWMFSPLFVSGNV